MRPSFISSRGHGTLAEPCHCRTAVLPWQSPGLLSVQQAVTICKFIMCGQAVIHTLEDEAAWGAARELNAGAAGSAASCVLGPARA